MESLKELLREAIREMTLLGDFVRRQKAPHRHLVAISRQQQTVVGRAQASLQAADATVVWTSEEAGVFKSRLGNLELFVYRDAGEWVWSLQTVEGKGARTRQEAQDAIVQAAKAAHFTKDRPPSGT